MNTINQILARMRSHDTLVCCGLDPDLRKMPPEILGQATSDEEKVLVFLKTVIDVTAPHVCAYKAQKAFFDLLPGGHDVLKEMISYVHQNQPGVPVIVDCKIGDTDNTMDAYDANLFGLLQADGVVVNPYMGDDAIMPLAKHEDKVVVVLVKTSNTSGGIIQDVPLADGRPFWEYLLDLVVNRWNSNGNLIPVVASTAGLDLKHVRSLIPDTMPILFAGVGAQGGSYADIRLLLNSQGTGVFVNSSRGLLYPASQEHWRTAIETATITMKEVLNEARRLS